MEINQTKEKTFFYSTVIRVSAAALLMLGVVTSGFLSGKGKKPIATVSARPSNPFCVIIDAGHEASANTI
ncbi:MAG: hypothetical protein IKI29_00215 [Clostridia bacterium]|nr:hypothetical protein [Clostridia bacterium]